MTAAVKLSAADRRALAILAERGPLRPRRFAEFMWPDSPGWRRFGKCGSRGTARGVGMATAAGGFLGKLYNRGLVRPEYRRTSFGLENVGYVLTPDGEAALAVSGGGIA